jgi:hypothetical protein
MQSHRLIAARASLSQAEWIAYFDTAYARAGWLTQTPRMHALKISELPPVPRAEHAPQPRAPSAESNR